MYLYRFLCRFYIDFQMCSFIFIWLARNGRLFFAQHWLCQFGERSVSCRWQLNSPHKFAKRNNGFWVYGLTYPFYFGSRAFYKERFEPIFAKWAKKGGNYSGTYIYSRWLFLFGSKKMYGYVYRTWLTRNMQYLKAGDSGRQKTWCVRTKDSNLSFSRMWEWC